MTSALELLLDRSRGPAGLAREVELDAEEGPLVELAALLSLRNGFFAFNAGVQVFRAGDPGIGPELGGWNRSRTWKDAYGGLADGLFCFGQDLFGVQFAVQDRRSVVTFDPETARITELGSSLEDWARWLLSDPDQNGCRTFATRWQDENGALPPDQRLIPRRFFVLGGGYDYANLTAKDAAECMRIRGPIAEQAAALPDGARLQITIPQYPTGDAAEHDRAPSAMTLVRNGVDVASGRVVVEHVDAELAGFLPLVLRRTHVSSYQSGRAFGAGWASTVDQRLIIDHETVRFIAEDTTIVDFPIPEAGTSVRPVRGGGRQLALAEDGAFTIADGQLTLHFGSAGDERLLTAIIDRSGNQIEFLRDEADAPVAVQHSGGYRLRFDTVDGLVTAVHLCGSEHDDLLKTYTYDEGRLVAVAGPDGSKLTFEHDGDWISGITDRSGDWFRYTYDEAGRCVRTTGVDGILNGDIEYQGRRRRVTDSAGFSTAYGINVDGRVESVVDPLGAESTFDHDPRGYLRSTTDPLGRTTRHTYDEAGNRTSTIRPDGARTRWQYDERGLVTAVVRPDGAVHRWSYDECGNLIREVDAMGAATTYTRNDRGHVTAITDALGKTRSFTLNAAGLPIAVTDALGNVTCYERDAFGRVSVMTDPTGVVHHTRGETAPDGAVEHVERNGATSIGRLRSGSVASGQSGRVVTVAQPDGGQVECTYDTEMRLVQAVRGPGSTRRYEYDPRGLLVRETDEDGRVNAYRYDAAGQLVGGLLPGGVELRLVRDVQGNVIERRCGEAIATFNYDAVGRLVAAMDGDTQTGFTYDRVGRLLTDTTNGRSVTSAYDALGRRVRRRTPSNAESTWVYDAADRPVAMRTAGRTLRFVHDAAGREFQRTLGGEVVLTWERDVRGRATAKVIGDQQHRREAGRNAEPLGKGGLAHDGSVVSSGGGFPQTSAPGSRPRQVEHDDRGRRVLSRDPRGTWRYAWDDEGRLVGVTTPDGTRWQYRYDALGRRVAKQRMTPDGRGVAEQVEFSWDGAVLAEQAHTDRRPNGPALGDLRATAWEYKPGTGEVLTHSDRSPIRSDSRRWADERLFAVIADLEGAPRELLDIKGAIVAHDPSANGGGLAVTPLRRDGYYCDPETGLWCRTGGFSDPELDVELSPGRLWIEPRGPHRAAGPGGSVA
ncbi:DUF6531 domain-containing protein [Saccharopolyspora sp. NPDC002686]|uniref:DUF6531 domain-containing protein n=1 Tax=Saccharopolyspora sp. NPDC002686 TaxID=3154541 RepID=UPI0033203619